MIVVEYIDPDSLGARAGFRTGDQILRINGEEVKDLIDFQVSSAEDFLQIEIKRGDETYVAEIEREAGEPFGLEFEDMRLRSCNNKCVFCFIHQMPKGMRRSLYFEDDDFRLSFLHGSYVTLTNVRDSDIERIVEQGLSPQYISVHATDPDLRQELLGRTKPTVDINQRLRYLADNGIEMHTQIVVCPGWNDGKHLERTVFDLAAYYPAVRSIALVPVGLTEHRERLAKLNPVTPDLATEYLAAAELWGDHFRQRCGERLVYAADELFLLVGQIPPTVEYYDAFPQLENGIGMVRAFLENYASSLPKWNPNIKENSRIGLVTGRLAEPVLAPLVAELNEETQLELDLLPVDNDFFGHGITVSGLLTGRDIIARVRDGKERDLLLLPPNCINGDGLTIDDMTVIQLSEVVGRPFAVGSYDLVDTLARYCSGTGLSSEGAGRQLDELGYFVGREL